MDTLTGKSQMEEILLIQNVDTTLEILTNTHIHSILN